MARRGCSSGRRKQLRRLVKALHEHKEFDPSIFERIAPAPYRPPPPTYRSQGTTIQKELNTRIASAPVSRPRKPARPQATDVAPIRIATRPLPLRAYIKGKVNLKTTSVSEVKSRIVSNQKIDAKIIRRGNTFLIRKNVSASSPKKGNCDHPTNKIVTGWDDRYGKDRERYYNNKGWSTMTIEMMERGEEDIENKLIGRDRDIQRQIEEGKIRDSRYNRKYKEIEINERNLKYLEGREGGKNKDGLAIRALMKLRCGNLEEENKYWLKEEERICTFCGKGRDNINRFIRECEIAREWFEKLGENELERERKIWEDRLDEERGEVLKKLWREKVKRKKEKEKEKEKEKT